MLRLLMRSEVSDRIGRLYSSGMVPSAEQMREFRAARAARPKLASKFPGVVAGSNDPENYCVVGGVAQICVDGCLSEEPDFWAWLFGMDGTTYEDIRDAFALAASDPNVKSVELAVSSPGGYVDGLFETLAVIETFPKKISVVASQACSAAYAIAAMAGLIQATGPASEFGSVGVAVSYYVDPQQVDIASTEAPNKRPDVSTPEGQAVVREELDAVHELFADAIARGRAAATSKPYSVKSVNADFGRGSTLLAADALANGMIDKIPKAAKRASASASNEDSESAPAAPEKTASAPGGGAATRPLEASGAPQQQPPRATGGGSKNMTKEELKAQHPEVYAAIISDGEALGVTAGTASERKRVLAHLKMAATTGATKVANDAIAAGHSVLDETVHAEYFSAAINRNAQAARQQDSDAAGTVLDGRETSGASGSAGEDLGDKVANQLDKLRGTSATKVA